jgi:hypothetical protein
MIAESPPSSPQPSREQVRALLNALVDQLQAAPVFAALRGDQLPSWDPIPAACHANADRWIASHPADVAVRGWLHEPFVGLAHRFVAHSVVRTATGDLVDVTLSARQGKLRFIAHPGSERDFFALLHGPHPFHELAEPIPGMDEILFNTPADLSVAEADETGLGVNFI